MGYPDNVLAGDERVVLHRHPHWKRLIGPILILFVVTALAAFGAGYVNRTGWDSTARNVVMLVIAAVWLVVVGWLTVWPFLLSLVITVAVAWAAVGFQALRAATVKPANVLYAQ